MAKPMYVYPFMMQQLMTGNIDFSNAIPARFMLLAPGYTPSDSDTSWADNISSYELPTGNGYTAGGVNILATYSESFGIGTLDFEDVNWAALVATIGWGVLVVDDTPVLRVQLDDTVSGVDYQVRWADNGVLRFLLN